MNNEQEIAFISAAITSELFRPILIKTLLSQEQVSRMLSDLSIEVNRKLEFTEHDDRELFNMSITQARIILFENHNLKL